MTILKIITSNILFFLGHSLVILSALTMGYKDVASDLKKSRAYWLK